ncbi:MAG: restriction endonuclease subunit S, partial [Actinomycetota bacterium]|nr:restriction endonuclease subunit S [Actinomycetota bacterium]
MWCTPTDITANNAKYLSATNQTISEKGLKHSSASLLPPGALLLCTRATIGEIKIAAEPVCTNQGFKSLVCGPGASNEFLFYKLVTLKEKLRELGVGSTFLEVSRKDIASLEVPMPKLEEQTAIATVTCSPKTDPATMRVRRPEMGKRRRTLDEEETHSRADRPQA